MCDRDWSHGAEAKYTSPSKLVQRVSALACAYSLHQTLRPKSEIHYDIGGHANRKDLFRWCVQNIGELELQAARNDEALKVLERTLETAALVGVEEQLRETSSLQQLGDLLERLNKDFEEEQIIVQERSHEQSYEELIKNIDNLSTLDSEKQQEAKDQAASFKIVQTESQNDRQMADEDEPYSPVSKRVKMLFQLINNASETVDRAFCSVAEGIFKRLIG